MKKHLFTAVIIICLAGALFTGCQKKQDKVTLTFLFYSPELQNQYNALAAAYLAETGITLDIELTQGNYRSVLAARINSGDAPDVFMSSAYADNVDYRDYTYDLTREDFIKNLTPTALEGVMLDGKVTGYPFLVQSHSYIYNKKVFRDAGITQLPKTLSEYEEACKKIAAIGVQPFATGFFEWWVFPQTGWHVLAPAVVKNYGGFANFVNRLNAGSLKFADIPEMSDLFDVLDLIKKYGGDRPLESDFQNQVSSVATGDVAMIHQGIWAEDSIKQVNSGAEIGFLEGPAGKNSSAGIMYDSNQTLRIYKDSKNLKAVLDFFRWLTTSQFGKNWIPVQVGQLSPIAGAAAPDSDIARETARMLNEGVGSYPWFYQMFPSGSEEMLGTILQGYAAGLTDRKATLAALDDAYVRLVRAAQ